MLKKAEEAEKAGNKERAEHWLKRAGEVEQRLKELRERETKNNGT